MGNKVVDMFKAKYQSIKEKINDDKSDVEEQDNINEASSSNLENKDKRKSNKAKKLLYAGLITGAMGIYACSQKHDINNPNVQPTGGVVDLLTPGATNYPSNGDTDQPSVTPGEEFDFSQLTNKYPTPAPIRTPEEIEASGEEVTTEDVENAFEYLSYQIATDILGESEVVSSKFISITPAWFPRSINGEFNKVYEPFYAKITEDKYYICINLVLATANMEIPFERDIYVSSELEEVLEIFGAKEHIITKEYLRQFKDHRTGMLGDKAHDGITIDLTNLNNLTPEQRAIVIRVLYNASKDTESLYENPRPAPGHER